MERKKSDFVSGIGTVFEIIKALSVAVTSLGGKDEDLRRIIGDPQLCKELAKLIVGNNLNFYRISVISDINEAVASGQYGWSNSKINSAYFTADSPHDCEVFLKHFDTRMSTDNVLKALDVEGLRPATISELLALGAQHPQLQQFPIVALGTIWQDQNSYSRFVGCLGMESGTRKLYLSTYRDDWNDDCRFLAVR